MAEKRFHEMLLFLSTLQQSTSKEQQEAGSLASTHEKMLQGCLVDLSSGPPINMAAATDMLSKVAAAGLPQKMQERLVTAIQDKVATPETQQQQQKGQVKDKACNQSCGTFYNYLTDQEWCLLLGAADWGEEERAVIKRCSLLRLTNPTEPGFLLLLALLCVCNHKGPLQTLTIAPKQWLKMLDDLKAAIRTSTKRVEHSGFKSYPLDPKDLPAKLYENAYPLQGPVPCKASVDAILSLTDVLPARKNHGSVAPRSHGLLAKDQGLHETFGAMSAALQHFQSLAAVAGFSGHGEPSNSGGLPGLTYLKTRTPKALPAASESTALPAASEPKAMPAASEPESQGAHSQAQQPQQQLALPAPSQKSAEECEDAFVHTDAMERVHGMQAAVLQHLEQKGKAEMETPKRNTAVAMIVHFPV